MVPLLFRLGRRGRTGTGATMPGILDWSTDDAEDESERVISGIRGGKRVCSCVCVPSSIDDILRLLLPRDGEIVVVCFGWMP